MNFNPTRLSIARKRRLLNQKRFAELVGVTSHTISRCEGGQTVPTDENVQEFSRVLGFPVEFFYADDVEAPSAELVSFRSQTSMTAATRDAALSAGAIGFLVSSWVESRFELPSPKVPDLHTFDDAGAARFLRQEWGLGEKPILNMVHLLESRGVRVFSLAENTKTVNAFSLWRDGKPYVFLNTMKSAEASRFDAAHELGHLVLHQDGKTTGREAEDQANSFASSFLMPKADVLAVLPRVSSLNQMLFAKKRWGVSLAALNYRLHKLGISSDWKYRDFCIQISTNRYNLEEPDGIAREKSVVWQKVLSALWLEKITPAEIARSLYLPESEVSTLIFGVLHAVDHLRPAPGTPLELVRAKR
jgi:Zn-dependent peptidase ImmA (M78 family)/DNA-binding XRE family transcriptional regulator